MDCCCCGFVKEKDVAIVENCGEYTRLLPSGCYTLMCPCETIVNITSLRIRHFEINVSTKTKDNVFVHVTVVVMYKVIDDKVNSAHYKLSDHRAQMKSYVEDGIRSSLPKLELDAAYSSKDEVATSVKKDLETLMQEYGYQILDCLITDLEPDRQVKAAMNDINASQRLREAANYNADAQKILLVKAAEAESESKYLTGVGIAKERKALMDGLRDSITDFSTKVQGTQAKDVMDLLLMTQYFDTMKDIAYTAGPKSLFLPHGPQSVGHLRSELEKSFMNNLNDAGNKSSSKKGGIF